MSNVKLFVLIICAAVAVPALGGCDGGSAEQEYLVVRGQIRADFGVGGEQWDSRVDINGVSVSGAEIELDGRVVSTDPVPVRSGTPFDVTVHTFAMPCMWALPSEVEIASNVASIRVFDAGPLDFCSAVGVFKPRTDRIVLRTEGPGEVVVHGITVNRATGSLVDIEFRFPVVVTQ